MMDPDLDVRPLLFAVIAQALQDCLSMEYSSIRGRTKTRQLLVDAVEAWMWLGDEGLLWTEALGLEIQDVRAAVLAEPLRVKKLLKSHTLSIRRKERIRNAQNRRTQED